jgi:DNA-binding NarL/FixJ family response regulator
MLRIMLVDDTPDRSYYLRLVLEKLGHEVVAEVTDGREMHDAVLKLSPDVIIVETESPSRDTLENLCFVTDTCPRPIVMFTQDRDRDRIREAISSGVTAYIYCRHFPGVGKRGVPATYCAAMLRAYLRNRAYSPAHVAQHFASTSDRRS